MSKELIKQRNLKDKSKLEKEFGLSKKTPDPNEGTHTKETEGFLQEDPNFFLLNNILTAIQFFENYERDIKILRENWFKEFSLESHNKKCFYADSLFRKSGAKVKFSLPQGINKNSKNNSPLHPLRIYITSNNVEATFDPGNLQRVNKDTWPRYQFTVKMDEHDEKSGTASLVLFNAFNSRKNTTNSSNFISDDFNLNCLERKSSNEATDKKFPESEKFFNFKAQEKIFLKCLKETTNDPMPANSFYCYTTPEDSLGSIPILKYRMNAVSKNDQEIPEQCFQKEVKTNLNGERRIVVGKFPRVKYVLNSAAYKGYFCDILIEKLAETLGFDVRDVQAGKIHQEFAIFGEKTKVYVTPAIEISDWNAFLRLAKNRESEKFKSEIPWPTNQMWEIMKVLPCYAIPNGPVDLTGKKLNHEKKFTFVFPKTEEFLLLHMMHSQIRCYFFILSIYKSFLEPEINSASLGPKHLRHLFFWRVHKNFLAWPDLQPAETLLNYLKALYKKLQNKCLRDFFMNSRNLFAGSLPKDLHKAQTLIKMILQNPIPYILQAITNLKYEYNFYPAFETLKIYAILNPIDTSSKNKSSKIKREKFGKRVRFEDADEDLWMKSVKKMQSALNVLEKNTKNDFIYYSYGKGEMVNFNFQDSQKVIQIFEMFILHYIKMGNISLQFKSLTQAIMYLFKSQSLFEFMLNQNLNLKNAKEIELNVKKLKDKCYKLEQEEEEKLYQQVKCGSKNSITKSRSTQQIIQFPNDESEKQKNHENNYIKVKPLKKYNPGHQKEQFETKL